MPAHRTSEEWIAEYATSHTHPVNRACHTVGIPMIAVSVVLAIAGFAAHGVWCWALALFVVGWIFQFVGHWYEKKPPEFLKDWRFLFVGLPWWFAQGGGRARERAGRQSCISPRPWRGGVFATGECQGFSRAPPALRGGGFSR